MSRSPSRAAPMALPVWRPFRLWRLVKAMAAFRRQRGDLLALDDERLRDIGLTRDQVQAMARQPLWDVPRHWLR